MAKSSVQNIIDRVKRSGIDYDITDTSLTTNLTDYVNNACKILAEWLKQYGLYYDNVGTLTLTATASQAYIDLEETPGALTVALAAATPGNVDDGTHYYKVTFVTADGETIAGTASAVLTVANKAVAGKGTITAIPLSMHSNVTARKIYRTKAGASTYYLLTTISDNTTLVYTDNTADASLGAEAPSITTIPSYSDIFKLTERTNDSNIPLIPYDRFIELYADYSANSSATPDYASIYNGRLYLGPTPSAASSIYAEYIKHLVELTTSSNMPFETKYDQLIIAMVCEWWHRWFDKNNPNAIRMAEENVVKLKQDLIVNASRMGVTYQARSREEDGWTGPREPS